MLETIQLIDQSIFSYINQYAGKYEIRDGFVRLVAHNYIFKGLFIMMLFWGAWYSGKRFLGDVRDKLLAILVVAIVSIIVGRGLALLLPFRPRPIHTPGLNYNHPIGVPVDTLDTWSSMPSDHAVLYFALAVGLGLVSRILGMIAILHAIVIIALPRIYLGLHYPSDILVGAVAGGCISLVLVPWLSRTFRRWNVLKLEDAYPYIFYPALFFVTFQTASLFDSLRAIGSAFARAARLVFL